MKILINGGSGIGDAIIALSLAKGLKNCSYNSTIDYLVSGTKDTCKVLEVVLKHQNMIRRVLVYNRKNIVNLLYLFFNIWLNNYDYILDKYNSRFVGILKIFTKKIITFDDLVVKNKETYHIVKQFELLGKAIFENFQSDIRVLDRETLDDSIKLLKNKNKKLIGLCVGTNFTQFVVNKELKFNNIKQWSYNKWIDLASKLQDNGFEVVLLGGKKELDEIHNNIEVNKLNNFQNYIGKVSLSQSICILSQLDLLVGSDTGLMHCAAALDIPTISLFGGTDPKIWRPYGDKNTVIYKSLNCSPCYGTLDGFLCKERKCMNSIIVDDVMNCIIENIV